MEFLTPLQLTFNARSSSDDLSPLDECLVLATQAKHHRVGLVLLVPKDLNICHVLRVTPIALGFVVLSARTPVQVDQTVVVSSCNQSLVLAHVDDVDVGAIGARGIDALDEPAKLDRVVVPDS